MMNGKFKINLVYNIIGIVAGVFLSAIMITLLFVDNVETETTFSLYAFIILGIITALVSTVSIILNKKAFFTIKDKHISAFCLKRIECDIDDISHIEYDWFTLSFTANGKTYQIWNLTNIPELFSYITLNRKIVLKQGLNTQEIITEIKNLKQKFKTVIIFLCVLAVIMFALIFILAALTDEKEDFSAFNRQDWIYTAIFAFLEAVTISLLFIFASKSSKCITTITSKTTELCESLIISTPLPAGILYKVYTNALRNSRLTVLTFPNSDSVYYVFEEINNSFYLEKTHISEIFENLDDFKNKNSEALSEFIDITNYFEI